MRRYKSAKHEEKYKPFKACSDFEIIYVSNSRIPSVWKLSAELASACRNRSVLICLYFCFVSAITITGTKIICRTIPGTALSTAPVINAVQVKD